MTGLPIQIALADVPPNMVLIASPVDADEVLPGETFAQALVRLNRVAVIHTTSPEDRDA